MRFGILGTRGYPSTYGGFETMVRHLAPFLRDQGHEVIVYGRDVRGEVSVDGISIVGTRGADTKSVSTLTFGYTSHRDASRRGLDAALVCNVANGFFLPLLSRAGIPTVVNVDGIEWERDKWGSGAKVVFRSGARLTASYANTLVSDSRAIAARWAEDFGRSSVFIPYGAPVIDDLNSDDVREQGIDPDGYCLVVARLVPENNVDAALSAFEQNPDRPMVVVGDANYRSPVARRVAALAKRHSKFRWMGHVADQALLTALWANSRVYIHGHSVGGTNPALLQAMGAGAPVLAYDSVYSREVLGDAGEFWLDAASLASSLDRLWSDKAARLSLGMSARERVAKLYSWSNVLSAYERVLVDAANID